MNIIWHGQSFFELQTKDKEGNEIKVVIDPFDETLGLKVPKIGADILLITHEHYDHSRLPQPARPPGLRPGEVGRGAEATGGQANKKAIAGNPFLIEEPGEYEIKGVFIKGIPAFHDESEGQKRGKVIMYKMEIKNVKICHLSDLGQKELNEEQLEEIGEVDILMVPVGGTCTIGPKEAATVISQIEPKIVIPMHYKLPKIKEPLESVEKFLKVMGAEGIEPQKKLKVILKDLPKEETEIVVLEP